MHQRTHYWSPFVLLALTYGCTDAAVSAAGPKGGGRESAARRSDDPRLSATREAIDAGHLELAQRLVAQIGNGSGTEGTLLAARVASFEGDDALATRRIEEARQLDPTDPRVFATAAELHAAAGRLQTAEAEIQRGLAACGPTPEMQRARGVYLICVPGGARSGLSELEAARERDPGLPFLGRPLGQAHLLVGKREMADGDPAAALEHAQKSLQFDPEEPAARRFHAECCVASGDLGRAIQIYEALLRDGAPLDLEVARLYKNHGVAALLQQKRELALESFRRARELGLTTGELGTGAHLLSKEAERLVRAATNVEDPEQSLTLLREATMLDPDSIEARHFFGVALFREGDAAGAAREWSWVVDTARLEKLDLPDPVHLSLARALDYDGRNDEARAALQEYLTLEPTGRWRESTEALLRELSE